MGIPAPMAEFLLLEHLYKPISGRVLVLGKQTIHLTPNEFDTLLNRYGLEQKINHIEIDNMTIFAKQNIDKEFVSDITFFKSIGINNFNVMDVSDYEGADIVHDLCKAPPQKLLGNFDFILNGSVLDNVFNPALALCNLTLMLKPQGRIMHLEMASNFAFPYTIFSPVWLYDYYVYNRFKDCKCYIGFFKEIDGLTKGPWDTYYLEPPVGNSKGYLPSTIPSHAVSMVIAEKDIRSTYSKYPIQNIYRNKDQLKEFINLECDMRKCKRPIIKSSIDNGEQRRIGDFIGCGNLFI